MTTRLVGATMPTSVERVRELLCTKLATDRVDVIDVSAKYV